VKITSPDDTALYHAIATIARERGAPIVPNVTSGFTVSPRRAPS